MHKQNNSVIYTLYNNKKVNFIDFASWKEIRLAKVKTLIVLTVQEVGPFKNSRLLFDIQANRLFVN